MIKSTKTAGIGERPLSAFLGQKIKAKHKFENPEKQTIEMSFVMEVIGIDNEKGLLLCKPSGADKLLLTMLPRYVLEIKRNAIEELVDD